MFGRAEKRRPERSLKPRDMLQKALVGQTETGSSVAWLRVTGLGRYPD